MSGVAPIAFDKGVRNISPKIPAIAPKMKGDRKPVAAILSASEYFFAPNACEMKLPEPCPKKNPKALMNVIYANDTPTAAAASVLICPTKAASMMLYNEVTNILMIVGPDILRTSFLIGACVIMM